MTAPVDVLAVMDADGRAVACVIDECKSWDRAQKWKDHLTWHDEARAAVAELLEADTEYELLCSVFPCPEDRVAELIGDLAEYAAKMKAADQRRHVALLRCKGGAA